MEHRFRCNTQKTRLVARLKKMAVISHLLHSLQSKTWVLKPVTHVLRALSLQHSLDLFRPDIKMHPYGSTLKWKASSVIFTPGVSLVTTCDQVKYKGKMTAKQIKNLFIDINFWCHLQRALYMLERFVVDLRTSYYPTPEVILNHTMIQKYENIPAW